VTWLMAIVVGGLYTAGIYLMLRRSIVKIIFGIALLGHACNLLIFTASGLQKFSPPLIALGENKLPASAADPVPQALILTAIVIAFAVQAFVAVLFKCVYQQVGSDDVDSMRSTDV